MSIGEIQAAVMQLSDGELGKFAEWFAEFQWQAWDRQIENDAKAGKLDALIQQANDAFVTGECNPFII